MGFFPLILVVRVFLIVVVKVFIIGLNYFSLSVRLKYSSAAHCDSIIAAR